MRKRTDDVLLRMLAGRILTPLCNRCKASPSWSERWCAARGCASAADKTAERLLKEIRKGVYEEEDR